MKLKELINIKDIKQRHLDSLGALADAEVENLSNADLCFIKGVSASSVSTMKKAGRSNEYILTHSPENKGVSAETIKKYISGLDEKALLALGFKKV